MNALIVVDLQYDFVPGGSLAVPDGDQIIPIVNELLSKFDLVIFTKDWHHPAMYAFASQYPDKKPFDKYVNEQGEEDTLWPDHCVENTPGADIHKDVDFSKCAKDFYIFKKGNMVHYHPYSGFGETGLADFLRSKDVNEVVVVGLALDYCVRDTALDAVKEGFKTIVLEDATRAINPDITATIKKFQENNIQFVDSWELEQL